MSGIIIISFHSRITGQIFIILPPKEAPALFCGPPCCFLDFSSAASIDSGLMDALLPPVPEYLDSLFVFLPQDMPDQ